MSVLRPVSREQWEAAPAEHRYIQDGDYFVDYTLDTHPWAVFVRAREEAIRWMHDDQEPPERILFALQVDLGYVIQIIDSYQRAQLLARR